MSPALLATLAQLNALRSRHPRVAVAVLARNARNAPVADASEVVLRGWYLYLISEIRSAV